jgi:hypothetical protein
VVAATLLPTTQFLWELREAMRGVGNRRRLRVDRRFTEIQNSTILPQFEFLNS